MISRYSTVAKAEKLIINSKVSIEGAFEHRFRFTVKPLTAKNGEHIVTCDRLNRNNWSCDCKSFALDQKKHCSHIIGCRLHIALINRNLYEYGSIVEEEGTLAD